jgi:hypothetical protein
MIIESHATIPEFQNYEKIIWLLNTVKDWDKSSDTATSVW